MTTLWLLAQEEVPEPDDVTAGWTGLIVLVLLAVATGFLLRSMNKRLRSIHFDDDDDDADPRDERSGPGDY
jgi:hypothetical protein